MKSHIEDLNQGPHLSEALKWFNVALRGLMEFGIVAAMSYWGYQAGSSPLSGVILAITAPLIVFGFWGLVDFHQAGRMSEPLRLVQELVISGLAAAALFITGQPALGWTLGVISIIYHGLVYLSGETLLKQK
ncbi:MAG: YrdB family protein [Anaerolineales bacterium]